MKLPVIVQRLEGLVIFLGSIYLYYSRGGNWLIYVLVFLVIDISMAGYLMSPKLGAYTYNIGHTYIVPVVIYLIARLTDNSVLTLLSIIWLSHISLDRTLGYGLKEITGFQDTHLGRIGKKK